MGGTNFLPDSAKEHNNYLMPTIKLTTAFIKSQQERMEKTRDHIGEQIADMKRDDPFADPERVSDNAAIDTEVREQESHQLIEAKIKDLQTKSKNIGIALQKISKKKYGICERCNKAIVQARLELLPEARYCVACEQQLRK